MPSLVDPLNRIPLAVVDVETTGASARWGDRIIEIGIVRYERGAAALRYSALIDPRRRISAGVTALTGISQSMVQGQPTFGRRLEEFLPLLQGALIVGHNVRFDLSFLSAEFRRAGTTLTGALTQPMTPAAQAPPAQMAESLFTINSFESARVPPAVIPDRPAAPHVLDTVRIARRRFGRGGNALQRLSRRLGVYPAVAHRALADAEATGMVLERLLEPIGGFSAMLVDVLGAQGGPMRLEPPAAEPEPMPMEILDAIEAGREVKMIYLDATARRSERTILPLRIRRRRGMAMLIAHCQLRNEQRTFKLDRIVTLEAIESPERQQLPAG